MWPFKTVPYSNVKSTIFQDRKLPFCCFRSKKDRMETFLNQNSGSKHNVFCQFSTFFDQKLLFCSVSKIFLNYLNVLFCLWKTLAQFVRFWFQFDTIFWKYKSSILIPKQLEAKKTFRTSKKFGNSSQKCFVSFEA